MAHWPWTWTDDYEGRWRSSTSRPKAPVRRPCHEQDGDGLIGLRWPGAAKSRTKHVRLVAAYKSPAASRSAGGGRKNVWSSTTVVAGDPLLLTSIRGKGGKPTRRRQKCRKLPFLAWRKRSQVTGWAHPTGDALRWAAGAKCPSNARGPRWPPEPTKCVMCRRHAGPVP